jgi:hypothetical protein
MKINFQTRQLLKNAQYQFHIKRLLHIMLHKNDSIIRVLQNRNSPINLIGYESIYLTILFGSSN